MSASRDEYVFLAVVLLLVTSFISGQVYSGNITGAAISGQQNQQEAWDFEDAETVGEYMDVFKFSMGDELIELLVALFAVFAIIAPIANKTLSSMGSNIDDKVVGSMSYLFAFIVSFGLAWSYTDWVIKALYWFVLFALAAVFGKFLMDLRSDDRSAWHTLLAGGIALAVLGSGVIAIERLKVVWFGWILLIIGIVCVIIGLIKNLGIGGNDDEDDEDEERDARNIIRDNEAVRTLGANVNQLEQRIRQQIANLENQLYGIRQTVNQLQQRNQNGQLNPQQQQQADAQTSEQINHVDEEISRLRNDLASLERRLKKQLSKMSKEMSSAENQERHASSKGMQQEARNIRLEVGRQTKELRKTLNQVNRDLKALKKSKEEAEMATKVAKKGNEPNKYEELQKVLQDIAEQLKGVGRGEAQIPNIEVNVSNIGNKEEHTEKKIEKQAKESKKYHKKIHNAEKEIIKDDKKVIKHLKKIKSAFRKLEKSNSKYHPNNNKNIKRIYAEFKLIYKNIYGDLKTEKYYYKKHKKDNPKDVERHAIKIRKFAQDAATTIKKIGLSSKYLKVIYEELILIEKLEGRTVEEEKKESTTNPLGGYHPS